MEVDDTEPITLEGDVPSSKRRTGRANLTVVGGTGLGTVHRIEGNETQIGRGSEADLPIDGEGVSRLHAKIVMTSDGRATLIDLGSTNGCYLNGVRVLAEPLRDNDRIQFGRSIAMVFRYEYRELSDDESDTELKQRSESMDGVYETIASTLDNLARMYESKGEDEKALATYRRSLVMHQEKLGAEHPNVGAIAKRVEMLERKLGQLD